MRRRLLWGTAAVALAGVAALALMIGSAPSRPPPPNPNGYDDFVKAGEAVRGDVSNYPKLERESLLALVSTNAEALHLLRLGLTRDCLAPMEPALTNIAGLLNQFAGMKRLGQLLIAEGRLQEMDGRSGDAARSYADAIRFGNEMSRGGLLISRLVGMASEAIGAQALAKVMPNLNPEEARSILPNLDNVDARRVTWAEVMRNERRFARGQFMKVNPVLWVASLWRTRQGIQKAEIRHKLLVAHERLVTVELALRSYQSEQGRLPRRLDDLVTNLLCKVPQDPFTSQPLVYSAQNTNWLLYSVGPDGVDDGGKPAGRGSPLKGDILFDSSW